eukprot:g23599.t1
MSEEAEALGRLQEGFKNPPKVDEKEAEENTNVQIGDEEIAEEHKREQSRQAVQRAELFKTEDSEIKSGSILMDTEEEPSLKPTEAEEIKGDILDHKYSKLEPIGKLWFYGQDTGGIKWRQGSFYLMKPNQKSVGNDTLDDPFQNGYGIFCWIPIFLLNMSEPHLMTRLPEERNVGN